MSTILYGSPSTASLVVHWLLIELGIEHQMHMLDFDRHEQKSAAYLEINPAGVVPTLVVDGQAITEAPAIVMHLADCHPQAGLAPPLGSAERGQYYRWMLFMANTLQPAYRAWFYAPEIAGDENAEAASEHARLKIEGAWQRVSSHLQDHGPYLLGERISAADFMLTMLMRWSRNMPRPSDTWPMLKAHANTMKSRPAFKEVYAREGLTDWT